MTTAEILYGEAAEVADFLSADETGRSADPMILRCALANALSRIAQLEKQQRAASVGLPHLFSGRGIGV